MPKKKIGKHLQFYIDCMNSGELPCDGLCDCADKGKINKSLFSFFKPNLEQLCILREQGLIYYSENETYWGAGVFTCSPWHVRAYSFTTMRQTIVLFMAALNNEL